ncbi:hypothetical protein O7635_24550 [Asanoa sp. WMMD1127]|uniref:hypothetical protein n=1 Tax=Asanoa sp. WMMD1127 TaxID=3016107 RepID=UPI002415B5C1|nr:hypothetical protein [Asanoa sp. WMMD1127]MDG4825031.1 hypothetical protein [Asanoa sp. WMMD1127]
MQTGVTYDTGFVGRGRRSTRTAFDPDVVRQEMEIIRRDLRCDAVRITGGDQDRLALAARCAADAGLEVWYSPFTCDLSPDELVEFLAESAERAERLRKRGAEVVLLTGSELSLFTTGFLPGPTLDDRLALLGQPDRLRKAVPEVPARINDFLAEAVGVVRARFGGRVSYASLPVDGVDWTPFDIISSDAGYRSAETAGGFASSIRDAVAQGKPFAVTEFGCTTYRGAAAMGGRGDSVIEWGPGGAPLRLRGQHIRDEQEQARYVSELLEIFAVAGVHTAFVNTFARYDLPHRGGHLEDDLDLVSYGIVKVLERTTGTRYPHLPWEPKASFDALAAFGHSQGTADSTCRPGNKR